MTAIQLVGDIIDVLIAGLVDFGTGLAAGVQNFVQALAISGTGENAKLSVWFGVILAFAGVSICIGITTRLFLWLENLGK